MRFIKIAYIGGGSKMWARIFMSDLALSNDLGGEIALYDIDIESANRNKAIGEIINSNKKCKSKFDYNVYENIDDALIDSDFVIMSILPGTFKEMYSDVHAPEKYGIYQSVGDTTGPGGVLRAMRTVPLYEEFARKIKECCPNAWVINLTNPMSICVKTLYDVFPDIKAFGCCHEVFHAQDFLGLVAEKVLNIPRPSRKDFYTDASGINHFTWISEAYYKGINLLDLIPEFEKEYYEEGYYERIGEDRFAFKYDTYAYGNKVKMDLYNKYGALAAAGDRHLVEFVDNTWYLKNPQHVLDWKFQLTTVEQRIKAQEDKISETIAYVNKEKEFELSNSNEEVVSFMRAILGMEKVVSNVNMPNVGQMSQLPLGSVVETNCLFSENSVKPIVAKPLPEGAIKLVEINNKNIDDTYEGIKNRDLDKLFEVFKNQPLLMHLEKDKCLKLFKEMIKNTKDYLKEYYNLEDYIKE
ncbi:MAG: alpha-glucosidase/alpha-galactosidase [Bacilli bacterium]|nr:alpha-glucosidase/alpha-galactosidase [Bacilli bacterium]